MMVDSLFVKKRAMNPLAPSKAAFYSAVIPGLGQIYNKRYWKVPIVWAAIGGTIYGYTFYDRQYRNARTVFKRKRVGLPSDEITTISADASNEALERFQNARQNDRDQFLLATILLYALNIIDANVDAHLKPFNIDDDLGIKMDMHPFIDLNPVTSIPNYGMALTVKF